MFWVLVILSLLFQACVSTPTPPLDEATSINLLNQSKESYQKCLSNNKKELSLCSVEKEIYETNLNTHRASFKVEMPRVESPKNFNHVLNWKTTWGKISTGFTGRTVFGRYPDYAGILKGSIEDDGSLVGYWFQVTSRHRCGYSLDSSYHWGTFRFDNFTRGEFYGKWAYCDDAPGSGGIWDGKRILSEKEK
jgi:hypothetical protein